MVAVPTLLHVKAGAVVVKGITKQDPAILVAVKLRVIVELVAEAGVITPVPLTLQEFNAKKFWQERGSASCFCGQLQNAAGNPQIRRDAKVPAALGIKVASVIPLRSS